MMPEWSQYGIMGLVIIGLVKFLMVQREDHKKEREEWKGIVKDHFDKADKRQEQTNRSMNDNTGVLQGLKTLLENRR